MIFVFDLDGTICFKGQPIEREICEALDYSQMKGHRIVFASARPIRDMLPVIPEKYHSCPMVGGNGAFTFENGRLNVQSFSDKDIGNLKRLINTYKLDYLVDSNWNYSFTGDKNHPIYQNLDPLCTAKNKPIDQLTSVAKVVLFTSNEKIKNNLSQLSVKVFYHSNEQIIDISPNDIDKAIGLRKLGILSNSYIAFGNDQNDLELFQHSKYSVCVGLHVVGKTASEQISADIVAKRIIELADEY